MALTNSLFGGTGVESIRATGVGLTYAISFDNTELEDTICQDIQASVNTQVQTYFEIGSRNAYRVAGRTNGQGSLSNVVGPLETTMSALVKLCDVCNPNNLTIYMYNDCASTGGSIWFKDCICTGVNITANAAQDVMNGSWTLMFSDVEYE